MNLVSRCVICSTAITVILDPGQSQQFFRPTSEGGREVQGGGGGCGSKKSGRLE